MLNAVDLIKKKIRKELSFEFTDWQEVQNWVGRAQRLEDNEGYQYPPTEADSSTVEFHE